MLRKIRIGRKDSGIGGTHIPFIGLLAQMTSAAVEGAELGSTELKFKPLHFPKGGTYELSFDDPPLFQPYWGNISVETDYSAGKATLSPPIHNHQGAASAGQAVSTYLVVVAPVLAFASGISTIYAYGGTDVPTAQSLELGQNLYLPILSLMGMHCELKVHKRGMLGVGGGVVELTCRPVSDTLSALVVVESEPAREVDCYIHHFGPHTDWTNELRRHLEPAIQSVMDVPVSFQTTVTDYARSGIEVALILRRGNALPAHIELWGEEFSELQTAMGVLKGWLQTELKSNSPISRYSCDQLIPVVGLAKGTSRLVTDRITPHIRSATHVTETLLGVRFHQRECSSGLFEIAVEGIGLSRSNDQDK